MNIAAKNHIVFSIIVPIFNAQKYLTECIESILSQKYVDFECILIDDGSTDNSAHIAKKYATKDSRIAFYQQHNLGSSAARNKGLEKAKGTHIVFLDSDDVLLDGALSYYADILRTYHTRNIEIIYTEFNMISADGQFLQRFRFYIDMQMYGGQILSGDAVFAHLEKAKSALFTYTWQGAMAKSFIDKHNLRFFEGIYHQDILFGIMSFSYAKSIFIAPRVFVNYRLSEHSVTRGGGQDKIYKSLQSAKSYAISAKAICDFGMRMKDSISPITLAFYRRCIATLCKRIMRTLTSLPLHHAHKQDKALYARYIKQERFILDSIHALYRYMNLRTRALWHFYHIKILLRTYKHRQTT